MDSGRCKKAINFDLDDKALQIAYPKLSYKHAWDDIKKFLLDNGFEHRQNSGYTSVNPMNEMEVSALVDKMKSALAWLTKPDVIQEIDVTDIGERLSLKHLFKEDLNNELDVSKMNKLN